MPTKRKKTLELVKRIKKYLALRYTPTEISRLENVTRAYVHKLMKEEGLTKKPVRSL
jgi:hypothetical protein